MLRVDGTMEKEEGRKGRRETLLGSTKSQYVHIISISSHLPNLGGISTSLLNRSVPAAGICGYERGIPFAGVIFSHLSSDPSR
jgi:hypothetical protein